VSVDQVRRWLRQAPLDQIQSPPYIFEEMRRYEASEDLFNQSTTIDEQPLWDIYAAGDLPRLRAEFARIATSNPEWKPSAADGRGRH
jgi:hypothetical protein